MVNFIQCNAGPIVQANIPSCPYSWTRVYYRSGALCLPSTT